MTAFVTLSLSAFIAYWFHHLAESYLTRGGTKNIKFIIRRHQIHHSFWGIVVILIGLFFASGVYEIAMFGYGIGNIWQHKHTHNRVGEKGLVFISKAK